MNEAPLTPLSQTKERAVFNSALKTCPSDFGALSELALSLKKPKHD